MFILTESMPQPVPPLTSGENTAVVYVNGVSHTGRWVNRVFYPSRTPNLKGNLKSKIQSKITIKRFYLTRFVIFQIMKCFMSRNRDGQDT